ncbi:MAG TPA: FAD-binding oxidoreductase [Longimicrobiaceae bacterium]|nr:FAD-binding oxidoreductase [Longimicrobiaceae bacterium]
MSEVVIVGAGIIGASVAYHLARAGCKGVRVLDGHSGPGRGSTGRATGGFRAQFGSEINVRLSLLSREKLTCFRDETGIDPGLRPCGYLFLAQDPGTLVQFDAHLAVQRRAGFTGARRVGTDEIREINPAVRADDLRGGLFCPTDGFLRPLEILRGYLDAARRLGVRFDYRRPCRGFRMAGSRIVAVETPDEVVSAGCVVNAAGAWAARVGGYAGVEVGVTPVRSQVAVTRPFGGLPEEMPMTIFTEDGFHLRVRDGRVLILRPDAPRGADPFDDAVEPAWLDDVVARARERVPCLADASVRLQDCWGGLYEMSPDRHALLGAAPGVENLYLANGSSGHGVMHAPALGQLLAEIILDGAASTLDVRALRPGRFAEGEPIAASVLL